MGFTSSQDEHFMLMALAEAITAFREREVPIGAVLVRDNLVLARAHNRCEAQKDPTAHAEIQVIRQGAALGTSWRLEGTAIYVTKEPCLMCAGAMVNARISRLVFGCTDPKGGAVATLYQALTDTRLNHQVTVTGQVMEKECAWLLSHFFRLLRHSKMTC